MNGWLIDPRDPLVVRDGRPNDRRSQSDVLPFPFPGTVAGLCRTRLGSEPSRGFTAGKQLDALRDTALRGPCLVAEGDAGTVLLAPAPSDAHVVEDPVGHVLRLRALHPLDEADALFDQVLGASLPVGMTAEHEVTGKPPRDLPRWWAWPRFEAWLTGRGRAFDGDAAARFLSDGVSALPAEPRLHVAIESSRGTHRDGMLFGATGLRFIQGGRRLSIYVDFDGRALPDREIHAGIGPMGGERRLGYWRPTDWTLPGPPDAVATALTAQSAVARVRLVLLTPAIFTAGWRPGAESPAFAVSGVEVKLVAARVPRPEVVSGWDFESGRPKPTRRMVPAGSVYWLDLRGPPEARREWLDRVWMQNVSDDAQDRRDGYGLAAVGVER